MSSAPRVVEVGGAAGGVEGFDVAGGAGSLAGLVDVCGEQDEQGEELHGDEPERGDAGGVDDGVGQGVTCTRSVEMRTLRSDWPTRMVAVTNPRSYFSQAETLPRIGMVAVGGWSVQTAWTRALP